MVLLLSIDCNIIEQCCISLNYSTSLFQESPGLTYAEVGLQVQPAVMPPSIDDNVQYTALNHDHNIAND